MCYELIIAPDAYDRLGELPPHACDAIERELEALASDPEKLGRRPPTPPYRALGQIYEFECFAADDAVYHFVAFFVFGPVGRQIVVQDMTVQRIQLRRE